MDNIALTVVVSIITALVGAVGGFVINNKKQNAAECQQSHDNAMKTYEIFVNTLKKNYDELITSYREMEKSYMDYREKYAICNTNGEYLRKELQERDEQIADLFKEIDELRSK